MQSLPSNWHGINPRHAATLIGALLAAWGLNDVRSSDSEWAIDVLMLGLWTLPELIYRGKTGKWPGMSHPAGYVPVLSWLATSCVWFFPDIRADYLPESKLMDAALIAVAGIALVATLKGMARRSD